MTTEQDAATLDLASGVRVSSHTAFIGGGAVDPSGDPWIESLDPSTGALVARVADSSTEVVDAAARSAHDAFGTGAR